MNNLYLIIETIEHVFTIVLLGIVSVDFFVSWLVKGGHKLRLKESGKRKEIFLLFSALAILTSWVVGEFFAKVDLNFNFFIHLPVITISSIMIWIALRRFKTLCINLFALIFILFLSFLCEIISNLTDSICFFQVHVLFEFLSVIVLYFLVVRFLIISDKEHHEK